MTLTELVIHNHTGVLGTATTSAAYNGGSNQLANAPTSDTKGGNAAMNIMQPWIALNYIIKT